MMVDGQVRTVGKLQRLNRWHSGGLLFFRSRGASRHTSFMPGVMGSDDDVAYANDG